MLQCAFMKRTSISLSDEHAALIEATGKGASEIIEEALSLYFQQDRKPLTREEVLMLISAATSAHEAQHHNKQSTNVPYRVTVKRYESPDFVAQNEAQRDTEEAEARWEAFKGTTIGDSALQEQAISDTSMLPEKTTARKVKAPTLIPDVLKSALAFILSEFEASREPTQEQVSKAVGMDSRRLGKALSGLEIEAKSIHRRGKSVKIYSLASKARVWELAALDAEGLQKMAEARARAMKNDRECDREHLTVFD